MLYIPIITTLERVKSMFLFSIYILHRSTFDLVAENILDELRAIRKDHNALD